MNKFYIKKDAFPKYVILFMLIIFTVFSIIMKDIITISITICLFIISIIFIFAQREILIEFDDANNFIKIKKFSSKILPEKEINISIENIERIKQFSTKFNAFHIIKLKSGRTINLPWQLNYDFDKFITKLDKDLSEKYLQYKKNREEKNKTENIYRYLFIFSIIFSVPVLVLISVLVKQNYVFYIAASIFAITIISFGLLMEKN